VPQNHYIKKGFVSIVVRLVPEQSPREIKSRKMVVGIESQRMYYQGNKENRKKNKEI
jgi:hypothetical protein